MHRQYNTKSSIISDASIFSRPINFNVLVELYPNHIKSPAIEHVE